MTETTETTTEPTTLHEHLKRLAACEDLDLGFWRFTVPEGGLAVIQRAIEDAATRPLQEEVERMKERQEADNDQYRFIVSQLVGNQSKYDALKAKADALRGVAVLVYNDCESMGGLFEAIEAYDAAEPREETNDGPDSVGNSDHLRGVPAGAHQRPEPGGEVPGGPGGRADGDGEGSNGVAAPSPDHAAQAICDMMSVGVDLSPSPDRDGQPGEADAIQLLALLMELVDRVTAVEHRQDVLGKNQADMRPILDRLDAIERSHRKLRKQHRNDHAHIEAIFERLVALEDALDDDADAGEGDALEKKYAECDVSWTPDGMQTQIDELRDRIAHLDEGVGMSRRTVTGLASDVGTLQWKVTEFERLRSSDMAAFSDRARHLTRQNDELRDRIVALEQWREAMEREINNIRDHALADRRYNAGKREDLGRRLAALEAEREPGAVPTVTPEAINAFCAMLENTPYEQLTTEGRYYVRRGLEAALKAGGAK